MNITTLSKLFAKCSTCGHKYFTLTNLEQNKKCRICPGEIKDTINRIYYEEINEKIEELYPRHMFTIYITGDDLRLIGRSTSGSMCFMQAKIWEHVQNRISYRSRPGEWKRKHKNKLKLVKKSFSTSMNHDSWSHIFTFLSWEEIAILYRVFIAQKE